MTPWTRVAHHLWIGPAVRPLRDEFDYVVSVTADPPRTDDGLRHRGFPVPDHPDDVEDLLRTAVPLVATRWTADKKVLIQSTDPGWAELIVACLWVDLGATPDEAKASLRQARPQALAEQRLLDHLREWRHHRV